MGIFWRLFELSMAAGILVIVVLFMRKALIGLPGWTRCLLWAVVAFRLVCPAFIETNYGILPNQAAVQNRFFSAFGFFADELVQNKQLESESTNKGKQYVVQKQENGEKQDTEEAQKTGEKQKDLYQPKKENAGIAEQGSLTKKNRRPFFHRRKFLQRAIR